MPEKGCFKISKEDLIKGIESGLSCPEIAKAHRISSTSIWRALKHYGLSTTRNNSRNINLVGKELGDYIVSSKTKEKQGKSYKYQLQCRFCHKNKVTRNVSKKYKCECRKDHRGFEEFKGKTFGRLKPLSYSNGFVNCECACGKAKKVKAYRIKSGHTQSCGCLTKENASKLGQKRMKTMEGRWPYSWYFIKDSNKTKCRSGYEVLFANYLIENKIEFEYEPHKLIDGLFRYTPDFLIKESKEYVELKGSFGKAWSIQKAKIDRLIDSGIKIRIMFWENILEECKLPFRCYNTYWKKAEKVGMSVEDYLGKKLYL